MEPKCSHHQHDIKNERCVSGVGLCGKEHPVFCPPRRPARGSTISTSTCTGRPRSSPPTSPLSSWTRTMSTPPTSAARRTPRQTTRSVLRLIAAAAAAQRQSTFICCLFLPPFLWGASFPRRVAKCCASPLLSGCGVERNVTRRAPCWLCKL